MAGPLLALAGCGLFSINCGVVFSFGLFVPDLCAYFEASKVQLLVAAAIQHSFELATGVFGGHLVELYGCHSVAAVGSLMVALGLLLCMFATKLIYFFLTYGIIAGIGLGFQFIPIVIAMARFYKPRQRALAMGVAQAGGGLGSLGLSPLLQVLIEWYGWKGAYLLLAGISLHAVPCAMLMYTAMMNVTEETRTEDKREASHLPNSVFASMEMLHSSVNELSQAINRSRLDLSKVVRMTQHSRSSQNMNGDPARPVFSGLHMNDTRSHSSQCDLPRSNASGSLVRSAECVNGDGCRHSRQNCDGHARVLDTTVNSTHCNGYSLRHNTSLQSDLHYDTNSMLSNDSNTRSTHTANKSRANSAVSVTYEMTAPREIQPGFKDQVRGMFDVSLLCDGRFMLPLLCEVCVSLAIFCPVPFIYQRAILLGVTPFRAALLMSIFGIIAALGRLLIGVLAMLSSVTTVLLAVHASLAVVCALASFYITYTTMVIMVVLYGLLLGGLMTLESLLAGAIAPIEKVHKAIGLQYSFVAVAVAISYPLAGALWDSTGCMEAPFYLLAACGGISFVLLLIWHVRYRCRCKAEDVPTTDDVTDAPCQPIPEATSC